MTVVRRPAVAGRFYPGSADALREAVRDYLGRAAESETASRPPTADSHVDTPDPADAHCPGRGSETGAGAPLPKAIIVPHAGYIYSGPVAGSGYARLAAGRDIVQRVVLLGPCHFVALRGLAASSALAFETPLGTVEIDTDALTEVLKLPQVHQLDLAHAREHSLEVHLPFLQEVLGSFRLVPLVVGETTMAEVAQVLELLWGGRETLIVVSSDLSHYHDYDTARALDRETSQTIEAMDVDRLEGHRACGYRAIGGLLSLAQNRGLRVKTVDLRNSGDTAGSRNRVVGYGAYVVQ